MRTYEVVLPTSKHSYLPFQKTQLFGKTQLFEGQKTQLFKKHS